MGGGAEEVTKEAEAIEDGDKDSVGVNEDQIGLKDVEILVVTDFAEHVVTVVQ